MSYGSLGEFTEREVFNQDLMSGEEILWFGKPDTSVHFSKSDVFLVPFSLLWGGFAIFWELGASGLLFRSYNHVQGGPPVIFPLFGVPFVIAGLYIIFGRFIYKYYRKKRTYYAVTNKRVLALTTLVGRNLKAERLNNIPTINKSVGRSGVGSIIFGNTAAAAGMYQNTGMDFFASQYGPTPVAFFDIPDADGVYKLVNGLLDKESES